MMNDCLEDDLGNLEDMDEDGNVSMRCSCGCWKKLLLIPSQMDRLKCKMNMLSFEGQQNLVFEILKLSQTQLKRN
eukprot:13962713-Alexandrium_andersonii.AAC.1